MAAEGRRTLAAASRRLERLLGPALLLSLALLLAGLFLPAISVRRFFFLQTEYSLIDGVMLFLESGDYLVFAVVGLFTVLFPLTKILVSLTIWYLVDRDSAGARRLLAWLAVASKYSMLDVFIIAVTVIVVDGRLLAAADVHSGILAFTAAILLSTYAVRRLDRLIGNR